MLLDNWLAQRAETCPDRLRGDRRRERAMTYAELEARGDRRRAPPRGPGRAPATRSSRSMLRARASSTSSLLHALMKLGAVAYPLNPRLRRAPSARPSSSARSRRSTVDDARRPRRSPRPTCRCSASTTSTRSTAGSSPAARTGGPAAGRAHLRQPPLERRRLGLQPRRRARRPLALLPAAASTSAGSRSSCARDLRDRGRGPRRLRRRPGRRVARGRRRHAWSRSSRRS